MMEKLLRSVALNAVTRLALVAESASDSARSSASDVVHPSCRGPRYHCGYLIGLPVLDLHSKTLAMFSR
jgi:hypothetical protein